MRREVVTAGTRVVVFGGHTGRGVVLLPEVRGVDANIEDYAQRLVQEGYEVAVPDPWFGRGGVPDLSSREAIAAAAARVDDAGALRGVARARDALGAAPGRAVVGFCLGGLYARLAACAVPGFAAAVEFYGRVVYPTLTAEKPVQPLDLLPGRACPLLCHFGTDDPVAPPAHVDLLEARLATQPLPARVYRYRGAGHGFANLTLPAWNAEAAALAWSRTLRWLDEHLPPPGA